MVQRRRRFPDNWRTPSNDEIDKVKPYIPYPKELTYAQVVSGKHSGGSSSGNSTGPVNSAGSTPTNSRPNSPTTPPSPHYYYSPHSPTKLRFPPLPTYPEWHRRCFNCCRLGHSAAKCRNPHKCGKCWADGHVARTCPSSVLNPAAPPFEPSKQPPKPQQPEPSFDELLASSKPPPRPKMPDNRPKSDVCFMERDASFFHELSKLNHSVVIYGKEAVIMMEVHEIVAIAVQTGLVRKEELRVAKLSGERFLLNLPKGLAIETFVKKLPGLLWDQGFEFRQWSVLEDANVRMPRFKILLDLIGVPMHMRREKYVAKAISRYGVYLGSVTSEHESDCSTWRLALATDDLARLPTSVDMVAGGLQYPVEVDVIHWEKGSLYKASDYPLAPQKIPKPPQPPATEEEVFMAMASSKQHDSDDLVSCSKRVLRELCQGLTTEQIPLEVLALLAEPGNSGEVSMEVLNELVFATDNHSDRQLQTNDQSGMVGGSSEVAPTASPKVTNDALTGSDTVHATVTPTVTDPPGDESLSRVNKTTNSETFGRSPQRSEERDLLQGPELETQGHDSSEEIPYGQQNYLFTEAGQGVEKPSVHMGQQVEDGRQTIASRSKPGQNEHRRAAKAAFTQPINTSQHNRFRGHVNRGRGRVGMLAKHKWVAGQVPASFNFKPRRMHHSLHRSQRIGTESENAVLRRKDKETQNALTLEEIQMAQA